MLILREWNCLTSLDVSRKYGSSCATSSHVDIQMTRFCTLSCSMGAQRGSSPTDSISRVMRRSSMRRLSRELVPLPSAMSLGGAKGSGSSPGTSPRAFFPFCSAICMNSLRLSRGCGGLQHRNVLSVRLSSVRQLLACSRMAFSSARSTAVARLRL